MWRYGDVVPWCRGEIASLASWRLRGEEMFLCSPQDYLIIPQIPQNGIKEPVKDDALIWRFKHRGALKFSLRQTEKYSIVIIQS